MADFQIDPEALAAFASKATETWVARFQPVLDDVRAEYTGRPVEEVKAALASRWAATNEGAAISDPELTDWAEELSAGRRIVLDPQDPA